MSLAGFVVRVLSQNDDLSLGEGCEFECVENVFRCRENLVLTAFLRDELL